MLDEDQERILNNGLKNIKSQSFHINNSIEKNDLRQCLKHTFALLCELREEKLHPRNYYHLYTAAFDQMQYVENFFKEEIHRGRRVKDLYDSVQQAYYIIPRIYLLITAGAIYMETEKNKTSEIIFDLLQMVKGIQNPIRGLFTRYYLLKMIKDKLPDQGNEYQNEKSTFSDTLKFILQNLEEMNRLWIRLSTNAPSSDKVIREKDRNELKILVGENITRLSSLNGLTLEIYQDEILPKIIQILLETKDQLSQQYLMECIIHAFPDDFNIQCMSTILDTTTKLIPSVDVKGLLIALMDKLARFVGEESKDEKEMLQAAEKIFNLLLETIDKLVEEGSSSKNPSDILKVIELLVAFMRFTIKCCPKKDKLESVNHILDRSVQLLEGYGSKLSQDGVRLVSKLLSSPLESELSLFDLVKFSDLMVHLDFTSRSGLALKIIESLVNGTSDEKLDDLSKVKKLIKFIEPLLLNLPDMIEPEPIQFEYEQNIVAKLIFVIHSKSPTVLLSIFEELKKIFVEGGTKRKKYTLPSLSCAIILLCSQLSASLDNKNGLSQPPKTKISEEFISSLDISFIDSNNTFYQFMLKCYNLLNEILSSIGKEEPEIALKLYLDAALHVNNIKTDRNQFEEAAASFINQAISIYQEGKYEAEIKYSLLSKINGALLHITILSKEYLSQIINTLQQSAQSMMKRGDQCNVMLSVSNLYYSLLDDKKKVVDCINKAKRFADFAMTNPHNLNLFVIILNKILYYIEIDEEEFFPVDAIDDVIEIIKNHIQTIKTESTTTDFLDAIESYFNNTLDIIKKRKELGKKKIYSEINLN